jgi:hypothetical protein
MSEPTVTLISQPPADSDPLLRATTDPALDGNARCLVALYDALVALGASPRSLTVGPVSVELSQGAARSSGQAAAGPAPRSYLERAMSATDSRRRGG